MRSRSRSLLVACSLFAVSAAQSAEPLSRSFPLDFFRDIPSRNLKGLATRSDGRLIAGPVLTDLNGPALPDLLWCLEPAGDNRWLVGTGPDGKIVEVTLNSTATGYTQRELADLEDPQVLAVKRLDDGSLLAGTSPHGSLVLVREGKVAAQVVLPVDSIFDLAVRDGKAYVATGNPGRIYEVDIKRFSASGIDKVRSSQSGALAAKGIRLFGEVRDRNVRRICWLQNLLVAGSSPKGNIYSFGPEGGSPQVMQENRDAEVAALLPQPNGDLYAAIVFAAAPGENRINRPATPKPDGAPADAPATPPPPPAERFGGRSSVVYFPAGGYPETVVARANLAFYALEMRGHTLVIAGGEQGDVLGYDTVARQSLSFAGSDSTQVNALVPVPLSGGAAGKNQATPARFLALRNNAPGLALIDFEAGGARSAETRRLDLGIPGQLGALRVSRLRNVTAEQVKVELRTNLGGDEIEGWTAWQPLARQADGWIAGGARARNIKLRLQIESASSAAAEIDDATLFYLPQNRRPQLGEFRQVSPNYGLVPAAEPNPPLVTTLSQLLNTPNRDDPRRANILNSQVVPAPGMRIVTWNVSDPDGDNVTCTFSIRREGAEAWTDLAVNTRDGYVQFDTSSFEDGIYATRLVAEEQAPRLPGDRLRATFDTDELVIDNTAPEIVELQARRETDVLRVQVTARDAFSLLDGAFVTLNNGHQEAISQPADGIRDSRTETFVLDIPLSRTLAASALELTVEDEVGNRTTRRVTLP